MQAIIKLHSIKWIVGMPVSDAFSQQTCAAALPWATRCGCALGCAAGVSIGACRESPPSEVDAHTVELHEIADRSSNAKPWFEESSATAGLHFVHQSGHRGAYLLPEIVSGGVAMIDVDRDGWLDVHFVQSGALRRDGTGASVADDGPKNLLYRNNRDGTFTDVTDGSGAGDAGYGMGVAVGDYDGDGWPDLYVTNVGPNVLLRNNGDWTFADVTEEAGVGHPGWGTSAAFVDAFGSGRLDLFVTNYVDWSIDRELACEDPQGRPDYCHPSSYTAPTTDVLYRNNGDGTFTDVSASAGIDNQHRAARERPSFGNGLGVACADFTGDGRPDIIVANDAGPNHLWINHGPDHDPMFTEEALERGCAVDMTGAPKAGMGIAIADLHDTGMLDLLVVNMWAERDEFFRNDDGYFIDAIAPTGLSAITRRFTRFGVGFHDFNNDGHLDLFTANGRVTRPIHAPPEDPTDPYAEPNLLFRGTARGRFEEVQPRGGTAASLVATSRAAAFGDVDNDGRIDIVVVNRDGRAHLLRNVAPDAGNWITFSAVDGRGADVLHAAVFADVGDRRLRRDVRSASSYLAASDPRVHVGLGAVATVRNVVVHWPDGRRERFGDFEADRFVTLVRGAGAAID